MPTRSRVVRCGAAAVVLLATTVWVTVAPDGRTTVDTAALQPAHSSFVPAEIDATGDARARAIFADIRRAQDLARTEAGRAARDAGSAVSPLSPTSSGKQESRRVALASELVGQALERIAAANGMTVGDLKILYQRGRAGRWVVPPARSTHDGTNVNRARRGRPGKGRGFQ